jgi:hypothetical protein
VLYCALGLTKSPNPNPPSLRQSIFLTNPKTRAYSHKSHILSSELISSG